VLESGVSGFGIWDLVLGGVFYNGGLAVGSAGGMVFGIIGGV